eukprot:95269_1
MSTLKQDQYLCSGYGRNHYMTDDIIGLMLSFYIDWDTCSGCNEHCKPIHIGKCKGVYGQPQVLCNVEICKTCTFGHKPFLKGIDFYETLYNNYDDELLYQCENCWNIAWYFQSRG